MSNVLTKEQFTRLISKYSTSSKTDVEWRKVDFVGKKDGVHGITNVEVYAYADDKKVYKKQILKLSQNEENSLTVWVPVVNEKATIYFKLVDVEGTASAAKNGITSIDGNLYSVNKSGAKVTITSSEN